MIRSIEDVRFRAKLSGTVLRVMCILIAGCYATGDCPTAKAASLDQIRETVRANEALTSLIKFAYEVQYAPQPAPDAQDSAPKEPRGRGAPYSGYQGTWAQDGIRQYHEYDYLFGPDKIADQQLQVVTGEVAMSAKKPGLMEGAIFPIAQHQWEPGPTLRSGIRPFEKELLLSDFLASAGTTAQEGTQEIRGREAWTAVGQIGATFYKTLIDRERGVLLRLEIYGTDPRLTASPTCYGTLDVLETVKLPNGGWLPIRSERTLGPERSRRSSYRVDPNSITIKRSDIPDSLFTINFPEGARVVNTITGTVTQGKKTWIWDPRLQAEAQLMTQQILDRPLEQITAQTAADVNVGSAPTVSAHSDGDAAQEKASPRGQGWEDIPVAESNPAMGPRARLVILTAIAAIVGGVATLILGVWQRRHNTVEER